MSKMAIIGPDICLKVSCVQFDKIIPKESVPNCQLQIANRYDNSGLSVNLNHLKRKNVEETDSSSGSKRKKKERTVKMMEARKIRKERT